jgi:transposase
LVLNASVNAYRRLDPHFEAPNQIKVSAIDRGSIIRTTPGNEKSARIEVRSVGPDTNGSGKPDPSGERKLTHPEPGSGDAVGVHADRYPGGRMLEVSQVSECRQLQAQRRSIRAIAKELGVSRNTVRGYVRGQRRPAGYSLVAGRPSPVSSVLAPRVREMLVAERAAATPRKQLLTAARIGRLLSAEGLVASESTVRAVVRLARLDVRDPLRHAFVPLVYAPGQDEQVDFFEGDVDDVDFGRVTCFILLARACYSGRTFAYAAPNQTREALFEGLMLAFECFGGVFRKLWFDNLTPAVRKILQGRRRLEQMGLRVHPGALRLRGRVLRAGQGQRKGWRGGRGEGLAPRDPLADPHRRRTRGPAGALCGVDDARALACGARTRADDREIG